MPIKSGSTKYHQRRDHAYFKKFHASAYFSEQKTAGKHARHHHEKNIHPVKLSYRKPDEHRKKQLIPSAKRWSYAIVRIIAAVTAAPVESSNGQCKKHADFVAARSSKNSPIKANPRRLFFTMRG